MKDKVQVASTGACGAHAKRYASYVGFRKRLIGELKAVRPPPPSPTGSPQRIETLNLRVITVPAPQRMALAKLRHPMPTPPLPSPWNRSSPRPTSNAGARSARRGSKSRHQPRMTPLSTPVRDQWRSDPRSAGAFTGPRPEAPPSPSRPPIEPPKDRATGHLQTAHRVTKQALVEYSFSCSNPFQ
jgi:hypothetical protein